MRSWTRSSTSGGSVRKLTPKGASVRSLTSFRACLSWSRVMVPAARTPSPPARAVAAVSRAPAHPTCCEGPRSSRHLCISEGGGIEHLADKVDLLVGGTPGLWYFIGYGE